MEIEGEEEEGVIVVMVWGGRVWKGGMMSERETEERRK